MDLSRINLNQLHTFYTVAGQGGVSRAAESLSLTRSAVSQGLSKLESQLGVRLFHRVGRGLVLTREGRRLHAAYDRYRRGLSEVLEELSVEAEVVRGTIRVGMYVGFSHSKLTGAVSRFLSRYPEVTLRMRYASAHELERLLARNAVDFAFSIHPPSGESGLKGTPLLKEELILVAAPGLVPKSAAGAACTPELVRALPIIDYYSNRPLIEIWHAHHFGAKPARLNVRAFVATADAVLALALDGAGAGVLPRRQAEPLLKSGRLVVLGSDREALSDPLWLNALADASRREPYQQFHRSIVEAFGEGAA